MTDPTPAPDARAITINIDHVAEVMRLGVRRAMAFIGLVEVYSAQEAPRSLSLSTMTSFRVLPDPLPETVAASCKKEFVSWVLGNSLAELDRFLHLFLDQVWHVAELVENGPVQAGEVNPISIEGQTNSAAKMRLVTGRIGAEDQQSPHWATLANARNCLMHQAGQVTPAKANHEGALRVSWRRLETLIETENGGRFVMNDIYEPFQIDSPGRAAIAVADHHIDFQVGEQINLRPQYLSEICFYYLMTGDSIIAALVQHCRSKRLNVVAPADPALTLTAQA